GLPVPYPGAQDRAARSHGVDRERRRRADRAGPPGAGTVRRRRRARRRALARARLRRRAGAGAHRDRRGGARAGRPPRGGEGGKIAIVHPYPVSSRAVGGTTRVNALARFLAPRHAVSVLTHASGDDEADRAAIAELAALGIEQRVFERPRASAPRKLVWALSA